MNRPLVSSLVLTLVLAASQPALACGEGLFNMGGGLRYQGYLAPRPATVLVYDVERAPAADRMTVYRGLVRAGHNLTIAHSPDELAHSMGQRSLEVEDMYARLDLEFARLLNYLDEHVGRGEYTVFLTADHGGADVPAYLRDLKGSAGYTSMAEVQTWIGAQGFAGRIDTVRQGQVFLKIAAPKGTADALAHALSMNPAIACAVSAERLQDMGQLRGIASAMARGYMPQRCGDVLFALRPGYFEAEYGNDGAGTEHGTAWNYDTQVPVIFFGKHVVKGEVLRRTSITDIAPTVSAILGMALPNAADGRVVPEVISPK